MTTVVIQQPSYLPWLGYFEQVYQADVFVFYDDVQYTKNDWRNRNRIKTPAGWQWLTVPVNYKSGQKICYVGINPSQKWRGKHLKALEANYSKAPYFYDYIGFFKNLYEQEWTNICTLAEYSVIMLSKILNIQTEFLFSKDMHVDGGQTGRLVNICMSLGADRYYSPKKSKAYLDTGQFEKEGIKVEFQEYRHPVYPQLYGSFIPYLSVVDLLFNCWNYSLDVILDENKRRMDKL